MENSQAFCFYSPAAFQNVRARLSENWEDIHSFHGADLILILCGGT